MFFTDVLAASICLSMTSGDSTVKLLSWVTRPWVTAAVLSAMIIDAVILLSVKEQKSTCVL